MYGGSIRGQKERTSKHKLITIQASFRRQSAGRGGEGRGWGGHTGINHDKKRGLDCIFKLKRVICI